MPEIAGQRLRRIGLTRGDIGGCLQPGKIRPETELLGWGTWIRTSINGVRVARNALTPSRLLRLSKNLPHDWKEQRRFLGSETHALAQPSACRDH
jgi:hypothetical protein